MKKLSCEYVDGKMGTLAALDFAERVMDVRTAGGIQIKTLPTSEPDEVMLTTDSVCG